MKKIKKLLIITLLTLPLLFGFGISGWVILNVKEDEAPPTYNYETILKNAYDGQETLYNGSGLAPIPTYGDIQNSDMIASGKDEILLEYRPAGSEEEWTTEKPKDNGEYEVRITNKLIESMGLGVNPYVYVTFTIQKAKQVITYSGLLSKTYDGDALEFLEEKLVGDSVMSCSNNYTITGTNGTSLTNVGSSDITVVATPLSDGNFLETTFNWTISVTEKNIQHADVSKEVTTKYTYTGQELKPSYSDIKITYNDMTLTSSDYEITEYENNKEAGTGKVHIKGIGNYTGTATIEFAIDKAPLVVELSSSNIYTRYANPIDITITTVDNTTISNENIGIKYFDEEKQEINYIPTIAGSYYVQVTIPELSNFKAYDSGLVSYTITPKSITELEYDTITDVQYTGSEITRPLPVITFDDYKLLNNTDYTLAYTDANKNVITSIVDAGSYFVKVTGIGNYCEDLYIPFKVVKHSIGSVTIDIPNQTYTGEALVPVITITDANDNPLVEGTDYEVVLGTYINANTYTITINGMKLYEGTTSATFTIDQAELTDANVSGLDNLVYNGLVQTINPVITFNEMNITGFTYTIKNNEEVKDAKTYRLVVTPTDANFKDTPFEVQFTVNDADVKDLTFSVTDKVYNATNQEPVVTIENIDSSNYTVTYDYTEFINVGTYTLTITGINNLTGTTTIDYHITKLSIENAKINYVKDQFYTGSQITPEISVSYKDITLINIDDYTITYGTNIDLGENKGSITITATDSSNFSGSQTVYFNISKQSIKDATITGYETEVEYTGHAYKPILTLTMGEKPLTEGTHYTVTYSEDIINAGQTSVITITGIGIYSGSTTINVEIIKANIKDDLSFKDFETEYTGTIYNIQVLYKDTSLPAGVNATYTVDNEPFSGTATAGTYLITATFTVNDNYQPIPTMTATLTITKATYDMSSVVFNSLEVKYDKQTHSLEATGMPDGVTVSYENNGQINVGTYTVIAKFTGDEVNYNAIPNMEKTLTITKHTPELIINEESINRDYLADLLLGNNYQVNNNLDNTKVTEVIKNSNDEIVEGTLVVGTYTVTITVTGNNNQEEVSKSFTLTIDKIDPDYTKPSGLTAIYGDYLSDVSLSEHPGWSWESNIQLLEVGTKYYKATYTPNDTANYNIITGIDVPVQVAKATLTGIKFDSQTIPYDTESHTITITGTLPTGVGVKYYYKGTTTEFKGEINVGAYEITAVITDSLGNYSELTLDATLTIEQSIDPAYKEQTNINASYGQTLEHVKGQLLNNWSFKDALTTSVGNAGEHEFTVIYTPTNNNYQIVEKTIKIIVAKIAPTFTVVDLEHVYNGSKLEATISHNSDGANFEYYYCLVGTTTQTDPINVGTYDIYVSISEGNNYIAVSDQKLDKQLVINKYTLTNEKVQFVAIPNQEYTGSPIEPEITVTLKDTTVKFDNTCYTVSYTDNTALGTATVTITGKDNFDGSATTVFVITHGGISDSSITEISDIVYTGKEVEYELVVTVNGKVLTKDTDYKVTVTGDTINVGTVTITVTGQGNYSGTGVATFEITPKSIAGGQAVIEGSLAYNGSAIKPITGVTLEGYTGVTYDEISYESNVNAGTASYTIKGNGNYTGTINGSFEITKATPVITITSSVVEITYGDTFDASAYYEVSNNFDAAISSEVTLDGTEVTNLIVGEYVVYVSVTENDNVFGATKSFTLKVNPKEVVKPTEGDTVYTYNGTEQTFTETSFANELIKVSGNKGTNVGSYTVTIELADKANYIWKETQNSDNYTLTYEIVAFDLNNLLDSQIEINGDLTYTSKQITPTVTITFAGDTLSNTLYDLAYGTNINVADGGTITISSLSDNFTGTRPVSFTIKQLDIKDATVTVSDQQYNGSALEPKPTVSIDSIGQLQLTTDYTLSYSGTHTNVSDSPVTITVTGTGNYKGNATATFDITAIDISGATVGEIQDQNYTGNPIEPKPVIYINGNVLPEGNYEVTYSNQTAVGTATITIKGTGNYTGKITKTFNIIDSIASADVYFETTVNEVGPFTYTGNEFKPTVIKVVINGVTLVENTDYKVTYENNVNANKGENIPKVIITPVEGSGYTGSKVIKFTINKATQTINSINSYSKPYDGKSYSFEATSSVGNGITYTFKNGEPFTGVTDAGIYTVTVTAAESDNYLEATKDVKITISSIDPKFVVSNNEYTYDGAGHQATVESLTETAYAGYNGTITIIYRLNGEKVETPTNAGNYDIYVTATAGTNWNAITEEVKVGTLTINKQKVNKPTANSNEFTYIGSSQTYLPNSYDEDTMNITDNIQTTANETGYTVTVSLENTNNYIWSDGTSEDITFIFVIKKADPTVETPTNLNGSYDALLSTVTLPNGWKWNTPNAKLDKLGSMSFTATYTPTDTTNYNIIEKPLTVSVSSTSISGAIVSGYETSIQYSGTLYQPDTIVVTLNGKGLNPETDYTINYGNVVNVGTQTIIITGKNNYSGEVKVNVTITPKELAVPTIKGTYTYNKLTQTFALEGYDSSTMTVTDNTGKNAGNYIVKVSLNDTTNYTWVIGETKTNVTQELPVTIAQRGIAELEFSVLVEKPYTGGAITQDYSVTYGDYTLLKGTDYEENYGYADDYFGTVTITVTGKGNYTGTKELTFNIVQAEQTIDTSAMKKEFTYNGIENEITGAIAKTSITYYLVDEAAGSENVITMINTAGTYKIKIVATESEFYKRAETTVTVVMHKATQSFVLDNIKKTYTYTGTDVSLGYALAEGGATLTYIITNPNGLEMYLDSPYYCFDTVGTYKLRVFAAESTNYKAGSSEEITLTVSLGTAEYTGPTSFNAIYGNTLANITLPDHVTWVDNTQSVGVVGTRTFKAIYNPDSSKYENTEVIMTVVVSPKPIVKPTMVEKTYTYNTLSQMLELNNFDAILMNISNNVQTKAGSYDVVITLKDTTNYVWATTPDKPVEFTFIIEKATVDKPTAASQSFTYDGTEKEFILSGVSNLMTVTGNKATNAGDYTVTITLKDKDNYKWSTDPQTDLTFNYTINKATVALPTGIVTTHVYNGQDQYFTFEYNNSIIAIYSDYFGTNVGEYPVTFVIVNDNYKWENDIVGNYNIDCYITSVTAEIVLSKELVYKYHEKTTEDIESLLSSHFTINYNYDDTDVTYTLSDSSTGDYLVADTYTVTVTVTGNDNINGVTKDFDLVISKIDPIFTITNGSQQYTGTTLKPTISSTNKETEIEIRYVLNGVDVENPTSVGTYSVYVSQTAGTNWNAVEDKLIGTFNITQTIPTKDNFVVKNNNVIYGDTLEVKVTLDGINVSYKFTDTNGNEVTPTNVGTYNILATFGGNDNWGAVTNLNVGTLEIVAKEVTLEWNTNLTYNGKEQLPTLTIGNLVGTDKVNATITGGEINAGSGYTATVVSLDNANYKLPSVTTVTYGIKQATLTITIKTPTSIQYGANTPEFEIEYSGFVNGETSAKLTGTEKATTTYTPGSKVGTYNVTSSGATSSNYKIERNGTTLTVTQRVITLTWDNLTFTYNGQTQTPTASSNYIYGLDDLGLTVSGGQIDAGTHTATASITNTNYVLDDSTKEKQFTINPFNIEDYVEFDDIADQTYTGLEIKPTIGVELTNSYEFNINTDYTVSYSSNTNAGEATVTITGKDNFTGSASTTFVIDPITIELIWGELSHVYDKTSYTPTASIPYGVVVNNETLSVSVTGSGTVVKTYKATASLSGITASNYTITNPTAEFSITQREVTITWGSTTLTYNGSAQTPTVTLGNVIPGDSVSVTVTGSQTSVGTGYTATVTELNNNNYCLPEDVSETFAIEQITPTISLISVLTYNYKQVTINDSITWANHIRINGNIDDTDVKYEIVNASYNGIYLEAHEYTVKVTVVGNTNVKSVAKEFTLIINKIAPEFSMTPTSVNYNGQVQVPTLSSSNTEESITITYKLGNTTVTNPQAVGKYTVYATQAEGTNWTAANQVEVGTFEIKPISPIASQFVVTNNTYTYDSNNKAATVTLANYTGTINVTYKDTNGDEVITPTNVGTYRVFVSIESDTNWGSVSNLEVGTLTISKATPTIDIDSNSIEVDYSPTENMIDIESFINNYSISNNYGGAVTITFTKDGTTYSNILSVGTYTVSISVSEYDNQNPSTTVQFELIVLPIDPTGYTVPTGLTATYGQTLADVKSQLDENWYFVAAESTYVGNVKDTNTFQVKYDLNDPNYNVIYKDVTIAVSKATIDMSGVTFKDVTVTYDGESHSITASNIPNNVTPSYSGNGQTDANETGYTVTVTFTPEDSDNYQLSKESMTAKLIINRATINMSGVTFKDVTVTYDGESHSITASNIPNGVSVSYNGNEQTNANEEGYTITATFTSDSTNYKVSTTTMTAKLVINKATLTITVNKPANITYGDAVPTFTVSYSGFVNGETDSVITTKPTVTTDYKQGYDVDTYTVTASGAVAGNYNINYVDSELTVEQKVVTLIWSTEVLYFNGAEQAPGVTLSGYISGDTVNATVTGQKINAGKGYVAQVSLDNDNYCLPANYTCTYDINKAIPVIKELKDLAYDYESFTSSNITWSDHFEIQNNIQNRPVTYTIQSPVYNGLYLIADTYTVVVKVEGNDNIETVEEEFELVISKIAPTFTLTPESVNYNGKVQVPTVSSSNTEKSITIIYKLDNTTVSNPQAVGKYTVYATQAEGTNWTAANQVEVGTFEIKAIAPTASQFGVTNNTYTYDSNNKAATVTLANYTGTINVTYKDTNGIEVIPNSVGTYRVFVSIESDTNWGSVSNLEVGTLTISKATPTIDIDSNSIEVDYSPTTNMVNIQSFINNYSISNNYGGAVTITFTKAGTTYSNILNVGTYTVSISVSGNDNQNSSATAQFELKVLSIDPTGYTVPTGLTATYGQTLADVKSQLGENWYFVATESTYVGNVKDTNTFQVKYDLNDPNYNVIYKDVTIAVSKATINMSGVTFKDITVTYDGQPHSITASNIPDNVTPSYSGNGQVNANETGYTVTVSFTPEDSDNYQLSKESMTAKLIINRATINMSGVTFKDVTVTYDGESHSITASNIPNGVSVSYDGNGQTNANEEGYTITATFTSDSTNYKVSTTTMTAELVINKASLTITVNKPANIIYGDAVPTFTVSYSGFVNGETDSVVTTKPTITTTYELGKAVSTYVVEASGAVAANYNINYVDSELTVVTRVLTITWSNTTVTYNGSAQKPTATLGNVYNNEIVEVILDNSYTGVGTYTITASINNTNYVLDTNTKSTSFVIEKSSLTIPTAVNSSFTYNGSTHAFAMNNYDESTMDYVGSLEGVNAGTYTVTITLEDTTNYQWSDESTSAKTITYTIYKGTLTKDNFTVIVNDIVYGSDINTVVTLNDRTDDIIIVYKQNGEVVENPTNVGTYDIYVTYTGNDNYNAITEPLSLEKSFSIKPISIDKPTTSDVVLEYTGAESYTYTPADFDSSTMIITSNTINGIGKQTYTVSLFDTSIYQWSDGSTDAVTGNFYVKKYFKLEIIEQTETIYYDNNKHQIGFTITGTYLDSSEITSLLQLVADQYVLAGVTYTNGATYAGSYSVTLSIDGYDTDKYYMDLNSSTTGTFIISKAPLTLGNLNDVQFNSSIRTWDDFKADIYDDIKFYDKNNLQVSVTGYSITGMHNGYYWYGTSVSGLTKGGNVAGSTYLVTISYTNNNYELVDNTFILKYKTVKIGSSLYTIEDALNSSNSETITFVGDYSSSSTYVETVFCMLTASQKNPYTENNNTYSISNRQLLVPYRNSTSETVNPTSQTLPNNVYSAFIVPEGITINISSNSSLVVGGVVWNKTEILTRGVLVNKGNINIDGTSEVRSYGFIKGDGLIDLASGSIALDCLYIHDWPGGNAGSSMADKVFPTNAYSLHNIGCEVKINAGAVYNAYIVIQVGIPIVGTQSYNITTTIIGHSDTQNSLFNSSAGNTDGYILKSVISETTTASSNLTSITGSNQKVMQFEDLIINGEYEDNTLSASVYMVTMETSVDKPAPIGFMKIRITDGSILTFSSSSYVFLPGSELFVEEGATININSGVKITFTTHDLISSSDGNNKYTGKYTGTADAKCVLNGVANIIGGYLGGKIETTAEGAVLNLAGGAPYSNFIIMDSTASDYVFTSSNVYANGKLSEGSAFSNFVEGQSYESYRDENGNIYWIPAAVTKFTINYYDDVNKTTLLKTLYVYVVNDTEYTIEGNEFFKEILHYDFENWYRVSDSASAIGTVLTTASPSIDLYGVWNLTQYEFEYEIEYTDDDQINILIYQYIKNIYGIFNENTSNIGQLTWNTNQIKTFDIEDFQSGILTLPSISFSIDGTDLVFNGWYIANLYNDPEGVQTNVIPWEHFEMFVAQLGKTPIKLYARFTYEGSHNYVEIKDTISGNNLYSNAFLIPDNGTLGDLGVTADHILDVIDPTNLHKNENYQKWFNNKFDIYVGGTLVESNVSIDALMTYAFTDNTTVQLHWDDKYVITYYKDDGVTVYKTKYVTPGYSHSYIDGSADISKGITVDTTNHTYSTYTQVWYIKGYPDTTYPIGATVNDVQSNMDLIADFVGTSYKYYVITITWSNGKKGLGQYSSIGSASIYIENQLVISGNTGSILSQPTNITKATTLYICEGGNITSDITNVDNWAYGVSNVQVTSGSESNTKSGSVGTASITLNNITADTTIDYKGHW